MDKRVHAAHVPADAVHLSWPERLARDCTAFRKNEGARRMKVPFFAYAALIAALTLPVLVLAAR